MALSNKEANCCDHIDRISDLQLYVIYHILQHLNIQDLVRTSILSRKWRYMWTSVLQLEFSEDFFNGYRHLDDPGPEISRIITQVLSLHYGPLLKFTLSIPSESNATITSEDLRTWIMFLSNKHIKFLTLANHTLDTIGMPFDVLSRRCQELIYLKLVGFDMVHLPVLPNLFGFKSLLALHLERLFSLGSNELQSLISGCPLLEWLIILSCFSFQCIDLSAPTVKDLYIEIDGEIKSISLKETNNPIDLKLLVDRDSVSGLIRSLPKVQKLAIASWHKKILYADMVPPSLLINAFSSLEYLKLTAVDLNDRGEFLYLVSVIKSASKLVELVIKSKCDVDYTTQVADLSEELECVSCCLSQLRMVGISVIGSQNAMSLIRFILANSPLLETLTFTDYGFSSEQLDAPFLLSISRQLLWMERASQRARVELLNC